jgi:hypothetical protein
MVLKKISDFNIGDSVYQFNIDSKKLEETKVLSIVEPYGATICKIKDYEATLNHRTLYETKKRIYPNKTFS